MDSSAPPLTRPERTLVEAITHATEKAGHHFNLLTFQKAMTFPVPNPTIVKVGANDGITNDPCADIIRNDNTWTGLLIEPVPFLFERLTTNYSDGRFAFENIAIGAEPGKKPFYYVSHEARQSHRFLPKWVEGIGAFNSAFVVEQLNRIGRLESFVRECMVDVETLETVVARHGLDNITLLHIDTEGHDLTVLQSLDITRAPMSILIEHKHSDKDAMAGYLHDNGYLLLDCGSDFFAMHKMKWTEHTTQETWKRLMAFAR